jgi:outer membrane protein OmpA-like peptidoglycan-associated protein
MGLCLTSLGRAETGKFNIHLEGGAAFPLTGWQAEELGVGASGIGKAEWAVSEWFGIQAGVGYMQFFQGSHPDGYAPLDKAYVFSAAAGLRLRLFNDEKGYAIPWGKRIDHMGNLWGHLWIDVNGNFIQTGSQRPFGIDTGLGVSLSLIDGLSVGPYGRFTYIYKENSADPRDSQDGFIIVAGLAFQLAVPFKGKSLPDSDLDGIFDTHDQCPTMPEDFDGVEDEDGCPDTDNDGDFILDIDDKCSLVPEDRDGFEDADGCPDKDNDGDSIPDEKDACPDQAEDFDKFKDEDGCPEMDNDEDGVPDSTDQCPNDPEVRNGFKDEDGCPEPDKDEDGFVDDLDDCPDQPETINGVKDDDGCPDQGMIEVRENKILLGDRIFFDLGQARVKTEGKQVLEQVKNLAEAHPEYVLISIEGHADKTGPAKLNQKLSLRRADAVRRHLIKLGIEPERLLVKGFGDKEPWKEGRQGMQLNRRVEVVIERMNEDLAASPVAKHVREAISANAPSEGEKTPAKPEKQPQAAPDKAPTKAPQAAPDKAPTKAPQAAPDKTPTKAPQAAPDKAPTKAPQAAPDKAPTKAASGQAEENPYGK